MSKKPIDIYFEPRQTRNHYERAKEIRDSLNSLETFLLTGLLTVSILGFAFVAEKYVGSNFKSGALLISAWMFFTATVFSFLTFVALLWKTEMDLDEQMFLGHAQAFENSKQQTYDEARQTIQRIKGFSELPREEQLFQLYNEEHLEGQINPNAKQHMDFQNKEIEVLKFDAKNRNESAKNAQSKTQLFLRFAILAFTLGAVVPLISYTLKYFL